MSTEVATTSLLQRTIAFFRDVKAELDKVTWPDRPQVVQLSIFVVAFAIVIGLVIAVIDLVLQGVLVQLARNLLGRG